MYVFEFSDSNTQKERYSKEQRKRKISDNYELHEF